MKVQNLGRTTQVFNGIVAGPGKTVEVPDGIAAKWIARYRFEQVEDEEKSKPKPKKKAVEDRI